MKNLYHRHGGPYDRGSADSFYGRGFIPHYYEGATYSSKRITRNQMTEEEIAAYTAGYVGFREDKQAILTVLALQN